MARDTVALAALGRQVAESMGLDPRDPGVDWVRYGQEAEYRIGRNQGVPDTSKFRIGHAQVRAPGHAAPRRAARGVAVPAPPPLEPAPRRTVRVGAFEVGFHGETPARHRPQHSARRGERTTGRFRVSHARAEYADPGYQWDSKPRYLIDTAKHVRAAWGYINQARNADRYTPRERRLIHARIQAAGRRFGIEFGHARRRSSSHAAAPHRHSHARRR